MAFLFIALLATSIGALSGVGGGVIIKPILDLWGTLDARTISLLSVFTVLSRVVPLFVVGENVLSKDATYADSSIKWCLIQYRTLSSI